MTLAADVVTQLGTAVAALAGRVQGALDYAELLRRGALPQATPFAFVVPAGLDARDQGEAAAGAFLQMVDESVSVILVLRTAGDVAGAKTQPKLDALVEDVVAALAGFDPADAIGVLALRRGRLVDFTAGAAFYQLDFVLQQQIRVLS